jgi:hypothetical protein
VEAVRLQGVHHQVQVGGLRLVPAAVHPQDREDAVRYLSTENK